MSNLALTCPSCGQPIPASVGECLYCPPSTSRRPSVSPNPFSPSPAASDQPTPAQLLLVAEECLARAQPDKATELAARALAVRPDSLEAKAVVDRARRLLARQRRRGRQEERLKEAQALLDAGDSGGAEKLVLSVLKRMPGHPGALALFARLKGRRLARGDAEAQAEQELARMAQGQARRAAEAARSARRAGWDRKAMLALRRGLRLAPDDPDLLALLRETEHALGEQDRAGARRRAGNMQVRAALDKLKEGRLEESLASLRSLLRQDPDHARAQAAVQEVRRAWLARTPVPPPPAIPARAPTRTMAPRTTPASPVAPARAAAPLPPAPRAPNTARPPAPRPHPIAVPPPPVASPPRSHEPRRPLTSAAASPPAEIAQRPTRRGTPLLLVLASAAVVIGLFIVLTARPPNRAVPAAARAAASAAPRVTAASATPPPVGPLAAADPEVREAVETTLAAYARALESQDPLLLARARPDLTGAERERLLAPFRGAINVATDLRVLDVIPSRGSVVVPVLRTDVIVGGRGAPPAPVEETLRFERRDGMWRLVAGSAR